MNFIFEYFDFVKPNTRQLLVYQAGPELLGTTKRVLYDRILTNTNHLVIQKMIESQRV